MEDLFFLFPADSILDRKCDVSVMDFKVVGLENRRAES